MFDHVYVSVWRPNRAVTSGQTPAEGECVQSKKRHYLNSPGGFKGRPGFALFIPAQRPRIETSRIAFYVQRAR